MTVTATPASIRPVGWWAIVEERARLRHEDGLDNATADGLVDGQMHAAAQAYLLATDERPGGKGWPDAPGLTWRPGDRLVHLTRAGALYLAEAERLQRAAKPAAARLRRAAMAVAEGLSNLIDRGPVPAQREDHCP